MKKTILIFPIISLLLSICIGLLVRFQLTGIVESIESLDFRRVHTHIGFYLVFFPLIWLNFKPNAWSPRPTHFIIYLSIASLALISFLFLGYGLLSKILSGLVLLFWLSYAIINLKKPYDIRGWAQPFIGIILATGSIGYLIFLGTQGETVLAKKAVRMFMTCLLWGAFAPLCLERKNFSKPNIVIWTLSVALTAIFVMDVPWGRSAFLGPLLLGVAILFSLVGQRSETSNRIKYYWLSTALSLVLFGLGALPNHHAIAVGGLHFFVLGPLLQTIFDFDRYQFRWIYHFSLLTMIASICSPSLFPNYYLISRSLTMWSSAALVSWMVIFLVRKEIFIASKSDTFG